MWLNLDRLIVSVPLPEVLGLFNRLASQIDSGFGPNDAARLFSDLTALEEDGDLIEEPLVRVQNTDVPFVVDATKTRGGIDFVFMSTGLLSPLIEQSVKACEGASDLRILKNVGEA